MEYDYYQPIYEDPYTGESVFDPTFGGSMPLPYYGDVQDLYGGSGDLFTPTIERDLSQLPSADYSNEGRNYPTPESTVDSPINITTDIGLGNREMAELPQSFWDSISKYGSKAVDFLKENPALTKFLTVGGGALLGALDKRPASGGGTTKRYVGPAKPLTRTITQGRYGPIAKYAAEGGLMQSYAQGGAVRPVPMQDGGFVLTKRAVDGAGGPRGIRSLVPEARMIRGPGNGTSDSIPAYIQGPNGRTPAKVSNGEAYVPPGRDTRGLYALMKSLERKA